MASLSDYTGILQETISRLDYPEIYRICSSSRTINEYCKNNYAKLLATKKQQYLRKITDQLIRRVGNSYDALIEASRTGNVTIVSELLNRNLNLSYVGPSALKAAQDNNRHEVVQLLLNNPNVFNSLTKGQKCIMRGWQIALQKVKNAVSASGPPGFKK